MTMSDEAASASRKLRPLLPRPLEDAGALPRAAARPQRVVAACEACRRLKTKCDGDRPACYKCRTRKRKCVYETAPAEKRSEALKRKYGDIESERDAYKVLFDILKTKTDPEALAICRRIRGGGDIESVLRHVEEGDLLLQLHLAPDAHMQYTFPYSKHMPAFLLDENPYLQSAIYESTRVPAKDGIATLSRRVGAVAADPYLVPYHAAEVVDSRFDLARAELWTGVIDDDGLFARLLRLFFQYVHPFWPLFHKDHFLDDMVSGQQQFCSPILVNAILAAACHGCPRIVNRADFWDPRSLECRLLAECRRLFELEMGASKLTTVQAVAVLSLANDANGCDEIGNMYLGHAVRGAVELGLFSTPAEPLSKRVEVSHTLTAWAIFGMQAVHRFHVFQPPIIDTPPQVPLPDPEVDPAWYGEIWLRYPRGQPLFPLGFARHFRAISKFRALLNDLASYLFGKTVKLQGPTPMMAIMFRQRFMEWFEDLPSQLLPENIIYPHQLKVHLHYYSVIITLFAPAAAGQPSSALHTSLSTSVDAHRIVAEAKKRSETLLRLYYLHHGFESFDILMIHFLSYIGFLYLKDLPNITDPETREARQSMLVLAAKGLYDQGFNCYLGEVVFQILCDSMDPHSIRTLHGLFETKTAPYHEQRKAQIARHLRSAWPVGAVGMDEDFEKLRLSNRVTASSETSNDAKDGPLRGLY